MILGVLASANRDETVFANGNALHLDRNPNPHLSLGHGVHFCLGAALSRMESTVCLSQIFGDKLKFRFPTQEGAKPVWRSGLILRGLLQLPICFEA